MKCFISNLSLYFYKITFGIISFFIFNSVHAQDEFCGFQDVSQAEGDSIFQYVSFDTVNVSSGITFDIPIHLTIVSDDNGNPPGRLNLFALENTINTINNYFTNGLQFFICDITFVNDTKYYEFNPRAVDEDYSPLPYEDGLALEYPVDNAISLFVVDNLIGFDGVASKPFSFTAQSVIIENLSKPNILAHELGHYFGLFHTFNGTLVPPNAPSCQFNGDFICDTPRDPGNEVCPEPGSCTGTCITDVGGTNYTFTPPYENLMSYYLDCHSEFSPDQLEAMLDIYNNNPYRAFLKDLDLPLCSDVDFLVSQGDMKRVHVDVDGSLAVTFDPIPTSEIEVDEITGSGNCIKTTDGNGIYSALPSCLNYDESTEVSLIPAKIIPGNDIFKASNGVTVSDITKITKHIQATELLPKPYAWIAADANNSGSISTGDIIDIRQVILATEDDFPVGAWRFLPQAYAIDPGFESAFENDPFGLSYNGLEYKAGTSTISYLDQVDVDFSDDFTNFNETWSFKAIKVGDVNFSADVTPAMPKSLSQSRKRPTLKVKEHECFKNGDLVTLELEGETLKEIIGYQLGIRYDPSILEVVKIKEGTAHTMDHESFEANIKRLGEIKSLWVDKNLKPMKLKSLKKIFRVEVQVKEDVCDLSQTIFLDDSVLETIFLSNEQNEIATNLFLTPTKIKEGKENLSINTNSLNLKVSPNPAKSTVQFSFNLLESSDVIITLMDQSNKIIT